MKKGSLFTILGAAVVLIGINLSSVAYADPSIYTGRSFSSSDGSVCICDTANLNCAPCGNIVVITQ
jgi:hypothetical protein